MIELNDFLTNLSTGELSNFSMSEDGDGSIRVADQPRIVNYINQGLRRLYTRFVMKELDVLIAMHEHITNYHFLPRFAVQYVLDPALEGHDNEPIRYILDLPEETFKGDVMKVLSVFDSHGMQLPLNDDNQMFSVFTPQYNILQVPRVMRSGALNVLYQANHTKLTGALNEWIYIPDILEEALSAFVAYKQCLYMNTPEMQTAAALHIAVYEGLCVQATTMDLVNSTRTTTSERFALNGWV